MASPWAKPQPTMFINNHIYYLATKLSVIANNMDSYRIAPSLTECLLVTPY